MYMNDYRYIIDILLFYCIPKQEYLYDKKLIRYMYPLFIRVKNIIRKKKHNYIYIYQSLLRAYTTLAKSYGVFVLFICLTWISVLF